MSEFLKLLVSDEGFIDAFWERVASVRMNGKPISQREAFEQLNDIYEEEYGKPRYPSFDAFRMARDRKFRKSKK